MAASPHAHLAGAATGRSAAGCRVKGLSPARRERGRKGGRGPGRPDRRRAGGSPGSGAPRGSRYFLQLLRRPRRFLACLSGRRRRLPLLLEVSLMGVGRKVRGAVLPRLASCGTPAIPAPPGRRSAPARTAAAHRAPRTRRRAPAGPGDRRRGGGRGRSSQPGGDGAHLQGKFDPGRKARASLQHFIQAPGWVGVANSSQMSPERRRWRCCFQSLTSPRSPPPSSPPPRAPGRCSPGAGFLGRRRKPGGREGRVPGSRGPPPASSAGRCPGSFLGPRLGGPE